MSALTVDLPAELQQWIAVRISDGAYVDAADYVRDLVRRDRSDHDPDILRLRTMVEEGIASGIVDAEPEEIVTRILADVRSRYG